MSLNSPISSLNPFGNQILNDPDVWPSVEDDPDIWSSPVPAGHKYEIENISVELLTQDFGYLSDSYVCYRSSLQSRQTKTIRKSTVIKSTTKSQKTNGSVANNNNKKNDNRFINRKVDEKLKHNRKDSVTSSSNVSFSNCSTHGEISDSESQ